MAAFKGLTVELSTFQVTILSLLILFTVIYILSLIAQVRYPVNLPRVGEAPGKTSFRLRTRLRYYIDCAGLFQEAYDKYSKNDKTCLIPGLGARNEIVLPPSALRWLTSQPDDVLSIGESFRELDQVEYLTGHHRYVTDAWPTFQLVFAFDRRLGTKTEEWTELPLWQTMKLVVAQGSSRFTVSLPFCRNEEYLRNSINFSDQVINIGGAIGGLPKYVRPVIGPIAGLRQRYTTWKLRKLLKPLFYERMQFLQSAPEEKSPLEPEDHLQMMLRYAQANRPTELTLHEMTIRLAMSNMASFHQTAVAITNVILNILVSDPEHHTIRVLREEIVSVLGSGPNPDWSKANIAKLIKVDSVMRETLRLHSFGNRSFLRKVLVDGLCTEDGIVLPKGGLVSLLAYPAHCDEAFFQDAGKFDPFRFSRLRESIAAGTAAASAMVAGAGTVENDGLESKFAPSAKDANALSSQHSFVSIGLQHMTFGLGRHACPGRFILDFELKMLVAYLLMNYEVAFPEEYLGKRPESTWVAEAMFPPSWAKIMVKRREVTWGAGTEK